MPKLVGFADDEHSLNASLRDAESQDGVLVTALEPHKTRQPVDRRRSNLRVGAFAFAARSKDSAMVATLAPGTYTAIVTGADGGSGTALVEVYEAN